MPCSEGAIISKPAVNRIRGWVSGLTCTVSLVNVHNLSLDNLSSRCLEGLGSITEAYKGTGGRHIASQFQSGEGHSYGQYHHEGHRILAVVAEGQEGRRRSKAQARNSRRGGAVEPEAGRAATIRHHRLNRLSH